ncbi:hypothetical protein MASR1M31_19440 [Porphyromonadaceae bacterium]
MNKGYFSKAIVALVVCINILFSAAVLLIFYKSSSEPVTLIGCWFAFTTGELWMLATIKKAKVRKGSQDGQN